MKYMEVLQTAVALHGFVCRQAAASGSVQNRLAGADLGAFYSECTAAQKTLIQTAKTGKFCEAHSFLLRYVADETARGKCTSFS